MSREFWITKTGQAFDFDVMSDSPTIHVIDYATHEKVLRALEKCREQRNDRIKHHMGASITMGKLDAEIKAILK